MFQDKIFKGLITVVTCMVVLAVFCLALALIAGVIFWVFWMAVIIALAFAILIGYVRVRRFFTRNVKSDIAVKTKI